MTFIFDPEPFGGPADGEWPEEWGTFINGLCERYPELASWGTLAIGSAWGDFSQDILAVSWCDWMLERDEAFLAYVYVRLQLPSFDFGGTGLFFKDIEQLATTRPWLKNAGLEKWPFN